MNRILKYNKSPGLYVAPSRTQNRGALILGGGHNSLICGAYLAKNGIDTLILERRHIIGGCCVTEEVIPGFKFSRASYLAGLLRPQIIKDLDLQKYGFEYIPRDPSSFTPTKIGDALYPKFLLLGSDSKSNWNSIAQFSKTDADSFDKYEEFLGKIREILQPILDNAPIDFTEGKIIEKISTLKSFFQLESKVLKHRKVLIPFYELFTGPAEQILNRWFESDILKTTLSTDAVIGALISPKNNGSAYVLLHHVMGEAAGKKGVWSYVRGGMGSISEAIAASARNHGAEICTNATVKKIIHENDKAIGVEMEDGSIITADVIVSGCSTHHTFLELLDAKAIPSSFIKHLETADLTCGAMKINCALDRLPNFTCMPSPSDGSAGPMHKGTIHFVSQMNEIEDAYKEAASGKTATRPILEMTIPSSLDPTLAPNGKHVAQIFVQYTPYDLDPNHGSWDDPVFKDSFIRRCFNIIDEFAPGFSQSVIAHDSLSPLDLERIFGIPKGNFHHLSLGIHQLAYNRPVPGFSSYRSPLKSLYMCSAATHPGGGVMGASGRNCANAILSDKNIF